MRGRWRRPWGLVLGCLGLAALSYAQQPAPPGTALSRPVQLRPGRRPLGTVLAELARQGRLPFSYSSSLVPLGHRCQVRPGPPRPLGEVLREVLASEHLAYGLLDGQLVLWPDRAAPPPGMVPVGGQSVSGRPAAGAAPSATGPVVSNLPSGHQLGGVNRAGQPQRLTGVTSPARIISQTATAGRLASLPGGGAAALKTSRGSFLAAARPQVAAAQLAVRPDRATPGRAAPLKLAATRRPAAAQLVGESAAGRVNAPVGWQPGKLPPVAHRRPVASLPGRPAALLPLAAPAPPAMVATVSRPARSQPDNAPSPPAPPLRGLYLHAEAWTSESLPLGVLGKVGVPRAYLLLGMALAANGRQSGPAFGLGLGTAGRTRGRFTPSLDVMAWRVATDRDREDAPILLTQLRPQLSWQVRRGGRLALVAGPTFNLAAARHRGPQPPRWDFGRDQWLWTNQADDESLLRLWPGVQVGVRF